MAISDLKHCWENFLYESFELLPEVIDCRKYSFRMQCLSKQCLPACILFFYEEWWSNNLYDIFSWSIHFLKTVVAMSFLLSIYTSVSINLVISFDIFKVKPIKEFWVCNHMQIILRSSRVPVHIINTFVVYIAETKIWKIY